MRELSRNAILPDMSDMQPQPKRGPGRPPTFTDRESLIDEVCSRLCTGEDLTSICRDAHMPAHETVYVWAREDEGFAQRIARARKLGGDAIAHRARLTLRGKGPDDGGESTGDIQRDKEIANFDLKLLAKWFPKDYGDSQQLRLADADGKKLDTGPLVAELLGMLGNPSVTVEPGDSER